MSSTLEALGRMYGTDKVDHGYLPHYERYLGHLTAKPVRLCEIGVNSGRSLRLWATWFTHPDTTITGVEIDPNEAYDQPPRVRTVVTDVKDWAPTGRFDVIIDDGSHQADDIWTAWDHLWPCLNPGGWYVIEDLATQWDPVYGAHGAGSGSRVTDRIISGLWSVSGPQEVHLHHQIAFLHKL